MEDDRMKSKIAEHYTDLSYIINGEGGVGKTTTAYEMGKNYEGYDEGTVFISCGREPDPPAENYVYFRCPSYQHIMKALKTIADEKDTTYKHTKFIAFDSIDELVRLLEKYTIDKANEEAVAMATEKNPPKKATSIKNAFGGWGGGINYANDLIPNFFAVVEEKCKCKPIYIGHIKQKSNTDIFTGVSQDKITCSVAEKYYNTIKDKVNIACCLYKEKGFKNVKKVKGKFGGEDKEKGVVISEKRVCVFKDDGYAIDLKTHFPDIVPKVEMDRYCQNFILAVEDAIEAKKTEEKRNPRPISFMDRLKNNKPLGEVEVEEEVISASKNVSSDNIVDDEEGEEGIAEAMASVEGDLEEEQTEVLEETSEDTEVDTPEEDEVPFDLDEEEDPEAEEPTVNLDEAKAKVSAEWKTNADFKKKGLALLKEKGIKGVSAIDEETYMELYSMI